MSVYYDDGTTCVGYTQVGERQHRVDRYIWKTRTNCEETYSNGKLARLHFLMWIKWAITHKTFLESRLVAGKPTAPAGAEENADA